MYSFYVFEGSFWQGGGGWEHLEVCCSFQELDASVAYYVRSGSWVGGNTFLIRVYRHGTLLAERELDPFLTVKVPGLTAMRSSEDMRAGGGLPEPGGRYDSMDEGAIWDGLAQDMYEIALECPEDDIQVSVDWDGLALPELVPPMLPSGVGVIADGRELQYGRNSTLDGSI